MADCSLSLEVHCTARTSAHPHRMGHRLIKKQLWWLYLFLEQVSKPNFITSNETEGATEADNSHKNKAELRVMNNCFTQPQCLWVSDLWRAEKRENSYNHLKTMLKHKVFWTGTQIFLHLKQILDTPVLNFRIKPLPPWRYLIKQRDREQAEIIWLDHSPNGIAKTSHPSVIPISHPIYHGFIVISALALRSLSF